MMLNGKRLVSFSMVKNEEDIIESFVRHNLKFVDTMYIADNMSTDGTRLILNELKKEGLPIVVWDDQEQGYIQSAKTTAGYHRIAKLDSFAYFIAIDADEFIMLADENQISDVKGCVYHVERYCHVLKPNAHVVQIHEMNLRLKKPQTPKILIVHDPGNYRDFIIADGNHFVEKSGRRVSHQTVSGVLIIHYPYRSISQYVNKVVIGWLAILLREEGVADKDECVGSHWRDEYVQLRENNFNINANDIVPRIYGCVSLDDFMCGCEESAGISPVVSRYNHLMQKQKLENLILSSCERVIDELWEYKGRVVLLGFSPGARVRRLLAYYRRHGFLKTIRKVIHL